MQLEQSISDLLYRHQCVVVPEFGAFLTRFQPARVALETGTWYPPAKLLSFNIQLKTNDGLLAKYIADTERISYDEALHRIGDAVEIWNEGLMRARKICLESIGLLQLNEDGTIQFQPLLEQINYLASSFGLSPLLAHPLPEIAPKAEQAPVNSIPPTRVRKRQKQPYWAYAASFLLLFSAGTVGYGIVKNQRMRQYEIAQQVLEKTIQQATFFEADPPTLPTVTLTLRREPLHYHIVAGAFRVPENAEKKIRQLAAKGYSAQQAGINKYGMHIVSYGSFASAEEALPFLHTIRKTETEEAWLWVSE